MRLYSLCFCRFLVSQIALSFLQYPSVSEEHEPLSSATASALSTGLLVDTNLEISVPDTYRPPPTPIPYDTNLGLPRTPPRNQESCGNKNEAAVQTTSAEAVEETNTLEETKDVKESDCKLQTNVELAATKEMDDELEESDEIKKSKEPIVLALEEEENMMQRIQKLSQSASIISISHAFSNGWREATLVLCAIRCLSRFTLR
ncbi:hypothetical protein RJ639_011373 [Escallonia herrerae]|uniref:Uncharacterized protein n=1 Tax=Escallonia herrerae TaxID=1293975 RepID=A0AA89AQD9_9ASTE|nr:hypothetical protein RJ639_011373 [Escallonia herrerae]